MKQESDRFLEKAHQALANPALQKNMAAQAFALPLVRAAAIDQLGNFDALRDHLKQVRDHTLANLDHYLRSFEEQVLLRGGHVHWAADAAAMNQIVADICHRHKARTVAKGKSMITEETALTAHLETCGLEVTETDLGEYIIQMAAEPPSHIVGPALHKTVDEIRELFFARHELGERELPDPASMVREARQILRRRFINAEVGIIGSNALIAENGATMLVTNEGNGDLVSCLPPVQIVCASIDKLLPRPEDATALLRLLARSAIGQATSAYTSFYCGPRREDDSDGPVEFHVVLLDNGRSDIVGGNYQDILGCMRCGACLNHCPVFMAAGGHSYGWVYPGPMGSVLTPLLTGLENANLLPNACTSCGRCAESCPAAIPLPDLLRDLRGEERDRKLSAASLRRGLKIHGWLLRLPVLYRFFTAIAIGLLHRMGRRRGHLHSLGIKNAWSAVRDFPAPEGSTFMSQWQQRKRGQAKMDPAGDP